MPNHQTAHIDRLTGHHLLRNWPYVSELEDAGEGVVWDRNNGIWIAVGSVGPDGVVFKTTDGHIWLEKDGASLTNFAPTGDLGMICPPGQQYTYISGALAAASTSKIRRSSDGGETWAGITLGSNDTDSITALAWSENIGYLAVMSISGGCDIYGSANGASDTWSSVHSFLGNSTRNIAIRDDSNGVLVVAANTIDDTYYTTPDGAVWTERTFSPMSSIDSICYNTAWGSWYATAGDFLYRSVNGLAWFEVDEFPHIDRVTAVGKALVAYFGGTAQPTTGLKASYDGGVSWEFLTTFEDEPLCIGIAENPDSSIRQLMCVRSTAPKYVRGSLIS